MANTRLWWRKYTHNSRIHDQISAYFGFNFSNETFANHSWYFRNALVRANYNDLTKGVYATTEFLEKFFRNLILNEQNELKNRNLQIDEIEKEAIQSAKQTDMDIPKCKIAL